jgi:diamine N-acetyltransferase
VTLRLAELTPENFRAAIGIEVKPQQQGFVGPVVESIAQAYVLRDTAWPRVTPRRRGLKRITVSWAQGDAGPERFYLRLGFTPTGEVRGDEIVGELML